MANFALQLLAAAGLASAACTRKPAVTTSPAAVASATCTGEHAVTTPPAGAIVVDASGAYEGSFATGAEGVAALIDQAESQTIFFMPGVYTEQLFLSPRTGPVVLQGYTCNATSYAANEVTITNSIAQANLSEAITGESRNDMTATLRLWNPNTTLYNLNVANTAGEMDNGGQALAVNVNATNQAFYGCNFTGWQDTVLADKGRQLYARSYIAGAVDFIFGRYAQAWFESCDIESLGTGWITASGRESSNSSAIYVINNSKVTGSGVATTYLGRPWRQWADVVFQNSEISDAVAPPGWAVWTNTTSTAEVVFQEFNNTGNGTDAASRVSFSTQRHAALTIEDVLGAGYASEAWIDTAYL